MQLPTAMQSKTVQCESAKLMMPENNSVPLIEDKGSKSILGRKLRNMALRLSLHPTLMPT